MANDSVDADVLLLLSQARENQPSKGRGKKRNSGQMGDVGTEEENMKAEESGRGPLSKKARGKCARICKGCKSKVAPEDCAPNFPGCWQCKRALDNISRLAHKQGKEAIEFVKKQRDDPDLCYNMVQSYLDLCPESCEGGGPKNKKRGTWSLIKYQERVVAASGFLKDEVGEMMGKRLYSEFAMTVRGGRKSEEQIASTWAEWESRALAKDPTLFHDYGGENGALRVWVKTSDEVRFRSSYMQEKACAMEGEQKKNATAADVDRFKAKAMSKHEAIADNTQLCQALIKNGAAAFQGNDGFLVDVMELAKQSESTDGHGPEEDKTDKKEGEAKTSPDKAKPWVDRDRVISSVVRTTTTQIATFKTKLEAGLKQHKESLQTYKDNQDPIFQKNFAGEIKILENRIEALEIVLVPTSVLVLKTMPALDVTFLLALDSL